MKLLVWIVQRNVFLLQSQEDEFVHLAVKHYYIKFGSVYNEENAHNVVKECIATTLIESKSMKKWIQLISSAHEQVECHTADRK